MTIQKSLITEKRHRERSDAVCWAFFIFYRAAL